jgi:hypothetical protein
MLANACAALREATVGGAGAARMPGAEPAAIPGAPWPLATRRAARVSRLSARVVM